MPAGMMKTTVEFFHVSLLCDETTWNFEKVCHEDLTRRILECFAA